LAISKCACSGQQDATGLIQDSSKRIDLAILDIHLTRDITGFEGLEIGKVLKHKRPTCPIVLTTGAEIDIPHRAAINGAGFEICDLIQKPFGFEELIRAIHSVHMPRRWDEDLQSNAPDMKSAEQEHDETRSIEEVLEECRKMVRAEGVMLFMIDPVAYVVNVVAYAGDPRKYSIIKPKLDLSPVRDVAIDNDSIFTLKATSVENHRKHRWLQKAYQYESCIGVQVTTGRADDFAYSLFAFHSEMDSFDSFDVDVMKLTSITVRHLLKTRSLVDELRIVKPYELMGKLYGVMAHDLTTTLSNDFVIEN
jgi:CheY-like chemotaxis protein